MSYHRSLVSISKCLITCSLSSSKELNLAHKSNEWLNSSSKYSMFCNLFKNSIVFHLFFIKFVLGLGILFSAEQKCFRKPIPNNSIIKNKLVYKVKQKLDGSIDRFKACLVDKDFSSSVGFTILRLLVHKLSHLLLRSFWL